MAMATQKIYPENKSTGQYLLMRLMRPFSSCKEGSLIRLSGQIKKISLFYNRHKMKFSFMTQTWFHVAISRKRSHLSHKALISLRQHFHKKMGSLLTKCIYSDRDRATDGRFICAKKSLGHQIRLKIFTLSNKGNIT
jgi:hypothetical protein